MDLEVLEVELIEFELQVVDSGCVDLDCEIDIKRVDDCGLSCQHVDRVESEGVSCLVLV